MTSILFVCRGNRFRSPLAAALMRREVESTADLRPLDIHSAGTWTPDGLPALPETKRLGRLMQLTGIESHRTRQLDGDMLAASDLIVVMEANHREALVNEFPDAANRVHLLAVIVEGKSYDIPDPGLTGISTEEVAHELDHLISHGYLKIIRLAEALGTKRIPTP
jgi:protein-tyrosine-phosphatase